MARTGPQAFCDRAAGIDPEFAGGRFVCVFGDLDALVATYDEEAAAADAAGFPSEDASEQWVEEYSRRSRRRDARHRAVIEFTCVALAVPLHEARSRPGNQIDLRGALARPDAGKLEDKDCWQALHCLTVYRNRLVVHHEEVHTAAGLSTLRDFAPRVDVGWLEAVGR